MRIACLSLLAALTVACASTPDDTGHDPGTNGSSTQDAAQQFEALRAQLDGRRVPIASSAEWVIPSPSFVYWTTGGTLQRWSRATGPAVYSFDVPDAAALRVSDSLVVLPQGNTYVAYDATAPSKVISDLASDGGDPALRIGGVYGETVTLERPETDANGQTTRSVHAWKPGAAPTPLVRLADLEIPFASIVNPAGSAVVGETLYYLTSSPDNLFTISLGAGSFHATALQDLGVAAFSADAALVGGHHQLVLVDAGTGKTTDVGQAISASTLPQALALLDGTSAYSAGGGRFGGWIAYASKYGVFAVRLADLRAVPLVLAPADGSESFLRVDVLADGFAVVTSEVDHATRLFGVDLAAVLP